MLRLAPRVSAAWQQRSAVQCQNCEACQLIDLLPACAPRTPVQAAHALADSGLRPRMQAAFTSYPFAWANNGQPACAPGANASTWNGVQCTNGRVSALALHFSNLYGPVSASLGNLSQLTFLIMDSNALSGALAPLVILLTILIPTSPMGNHQKVLGACRLFPARPFESSSATRQRSLTKAALLSSCNPANVILVLCRRRTGTLPASLGNLKLLTYLNMAMNWLSGKCAWAALVPARSPRSTRCCLQT